MIAIEKMGTDTCDLTQKEGEGVYIRYEDGASGFLTWKGLKQILALEERKREKRNGQPEA